MAELPTEATYDLETVLSAVVTVATRIPPDALTAGVLGTERAGHGVLIDRGLVLTIGYLVTEAHEVWLTLADGQTVPGDVLGYDQATGFGLIQALAQVEQKPLPLGSSANSAVGEPVLVAGSGGAENVIPARLVAKQEFAGYWEYVLDEALFTAPAHPNWGGTAVVNNAGELIGVGSLQIQEAEVNGQTEDLNMVVPIDLLKEILTDLRTTGRANRKPRPWLGLYATEAEEHVVVLGLSERGPARDAGIEPGDVIVAVDGTEISGLAQFFRTVWACGEAGCDIEFSLIRDGRMRQALVTTEDRMSLLRRPQIH